MAKRSSPSRLGSTPTTSGPIPSTVRLRAFSTASALMKPSWPVVWNASAAVAGYSCMNNSGVLQLGQLGAPPGQLLRVQPMQGAIGGLLGGGGEAVRDPPPVVVRPEPRAEDRDVVADPRLGSAPALEELALRPVGGGFRMTSVPSRSGTACTTPAKWPAAFFQKAASEPWNSWTVLDRPAASAPAVPTV